MFADKERMMYGRQSECAIAIMSRLAEVYDEGETLLSAAEVADSRGLKRPFVAKILTQLSQAGLVIGSRGPGGGATLSRHPKKIKLIDVFSIFERRNKDDRCPFGGGICGIGSDCPLHDKLVAVQKAFDHLLCDTTFEQFRKEAQSTKGRRQSISKKKKARKRASYRAPPTNTRRC